MSGVLNKVAYHFTGPKLRDGTPLPAIGRKLVFNGEPLLCEQGLHFSLHPFDALQYAPGPLLHKVHYGGIVEMGDDKGVCTERIIIASIDATDMLRKFACDEALRVLPKDAPDIVRRYLTTRDEGLRDVARDAARNEARSAAWEAAWSAARDAAWYAAWDAARSAALDAAYSAAWSMAWSVAWDAACDKERKRQRATFLALVQQAFTKKWENI